MIRPARITSERQRQHPLVSVQFSPVHFLVPCDTSELPRGVSRTATKEYQCTIGRFCSTGPRSFHSRLATTANWGNGFCKRRPSPHEAHPRNQKPPDCGIAHLQLKSRSECLRFRSGCGDPAALNRSRASRADSKYFQRKRAPSLFFRTVQ